jgi:hypothetical protein
MADNFEVFKQNISYLSERSDILNDQKKITFELTAQRLSEGYGTSQNEISDAYDILSNASASDCIAFFSVLSQNSSSLSKLFLEHDEPYDLFSRTAASKISYVKNNYNDIAFLRFSELFEKPTVSYGATFEEICEDVYNSESEYCILPIECSSNGKMFSFYSLINKYELKIFAICDVDEGISGKRTRYALLSRKTLIYPNDTQNEYFEFSIIGSKDYRLSDILEAANSASISIYRIDTLPVPYDDLKFRFYHIFEGNRKDIIPFIMYLNYKYPQYEVIGNYILI